MVSVEDAEGARRLTGLAAQLTAAGALRGPEWQAAFRAVRRHVFVPRFWHDDDPGAFPARWRMVDHATVDHDEWLDAVYSDRTLATELTGTPAHDGRGRHPQVTSSTTMPSLMMAMLEALDLDQGMRVLEIGTGTGYQTALLCQRLGDQHVFSIDIGPETTALAGVRLARHGYRPRLATGDGGDGLPEEAPFDRIIASCGLDTLPAPWLAQTREGGKILVNLLGPFNQHALVLLAVNDGAASGRFLAQTGGFMPRRLDPAQPHEPRVSSGAVHRQLARVHHHGHSRLDPAELYCEPAWGLIAQTHLSDTVSRQVFADPEHTDHPGRCTELTTVDGAAWALIDHDAGPEGHPVTQVGPRRLWDELETLHRAWIQHGRPGVDRYGITVPPPQLVQEPAGEWHPTIPAAAGPVWAPLLWLDDPVTAPAWSGRAGIHGCNRS